MAVKHLLLVFAIGLTVAAAQDVNEALNNLPPELQGKVSSDQIQEIQNKTSKAFREKCEKNGGAGTYGNVEGAFTTFTTCVQALVNKEQLEKEIEDAKPTGQVDEVFKKYCAKTPSFKQCFRNMTEAVRPCFSVDERKHLKTVYNISEQLADFVCFKEGDRIALFIAEHGPECLQEKQDEIQACVNSTFGSDMKVDTSSLSVDSIPTIAFGEKECGQFTELQTCVVAALERCEQPTAANIVESLFKFARKATPCNSFQQTSGRADDASRAKTTAANPTEVKVNSASTHFIATAALFAAFLTRLV